MCRSMVDIQSVAAEIRQGKKKKKDRKKLQGKNIMAPLFHRAAINTGQLTNCLIHEHLENGHQERACGRCAVPDKLPAVCVHDQ